MNSDFKQNESLQTLSDKKKFKSIIEALLFVSGNEVELKDIAEIIEKSEDSTIQLLDEMILDYNNSCRGIMLIKFGHKYQLRSKPEYSSFIAKLIPSKQKQVLSQAALETLAVIAYNQPITKAKIDHIRGVSSDSSVSKLLQRNLITPTGKSDAPGNPNLYVTTDEFLCLFGLESCSELIE